MSSLWDIVKTVGTGVLATVAGPAAPLVIGAINAVLPDDAQLPDNATGQQAQDALATIPAEQRAALMDKQFEVELTTIRETHDTLRTMLTADATTPHTTRPYIAKQAFHVIAFSVVVTTAMWAYAVVRGDELMVTAIMNGWPFIVGVNGTLATLLLSYFGVLKQEQKNKLEAANGGIKPTGFAALVSGLVNRK